MNALKSIITNTIIETISPRGEKEQHFRKKAKKMLNRSNDKLNKKIKLDMYGESEIDHISAKMFSDDQVLRKNKCQECNAKYMFNYLRYLNNKIARASKYSEIDKILKENNNAIKDVIDVCGLNNPLIDKIISYVLNQGVDLGNSLICFNDYENSNIINKVENGITNRKENGSLLSDPLSKDDLYEYIKYMAISNTIFDELHLAYLFFEMSRVNKEDLDESLNVYWTIILIKYAYLLAKNYHLNDLIVFADNINEMPENKNLGFAIKTDICNEKLNGINIIYSNIKDWELDINMVAHEVEHIRINSQNKFSFETFLIKMEKLMDYSIDDLDYNQYMQDNYRKRYSEILAHNKGFIFEKSLINNSEVIDLDKLDAINKRIETNKKYLNSKSKKVGDDYYFNFTLFRLAIKKYKLYAKLKYGDKYKEKMGLSNVIKLLLDDDYNILSYEALLDRYNVNESFLATFPNNEEAKARKYIYEWALENYTYKEDKIDKDKCLKR